MPSERELVGTMPVRLDTPVPTVSVVIPVHNRPDGVRRAVESVLAQTHQAFEIMVIDDGSSDATADAVLAIGDPRIRLIRHDRRRGASAARNTGIRLGAAPYIAFLDSDDEWLPLKLERQLEVFERAGDRLGLVSSGAVRVFADGTHQRRMPPRGADLPVALLTRNVVGETSLGMVSRRALDRVGWFDETLPASQDIDLWLRISERFDVDFVPEVLVRIDKGPDSGRITNNLTSAMRGRELFCAKHRDKLVRHGVLHDFLRKSGWRHQRARRDPRLARRFYLASIGARPVAPLAYVLFAVACLPMSWVDCMARWRRGVRRLLRASGDPAGGVRRAGARPWTSRSRWEPAS